MSQYLKAVQQTFSQRYTKWGRTQNISTNIKEQTKGVHFHCLLNIVLEFLARDKRNKRHTNRKGLKMIRFYI